VDFGHEQAALTRDNRNSGGVDEQFCCDGWQLNLAWHTTTTSHVCKIALIGYGDRATGSSPANSDNALAQ